MCFKYRKALIAAIEDSIFLAPLLLNIEQVVCTIFKKLFAKIYRKEVDKMLSPAVVGFLVVAAILYFLMSKRLSAIVALIAIPVIGAIVLGKAPELGKHINAGILSVAPTGVMFIFSILFFGLMRDNGAFDPIVGKIIKVSNGNPMYVAIGTYIIALIGHLDGAGATTFLLVVPAMLPIYEKMGMNKLVLVCCTAMGAGIMNLTPWGGPTLRAATALQMDVMTLYKPLIIPQIVGILSGLLLAAYMGRREGKKLGDRIDIGDIGYSVELSAAELALKRPKLILFNILLIVLVIGIMISGKLAPAPAFMLGTALAMIVNYPDSATQRKLVDLHAKEAMLMAGVLFAAGVLMGVLKGTGMATGMAKAMVAVIPADSGNLLVYITGYVSAPLSFIFDPDSYYFGVMPIIVESVKALGIPAADIARASLMGQMTLGFPISPLTPATFLLVGLAGVEMGDHQKYTFPFLWAISAIMMTVAIVIGVFR